MLYFEKEYTSQWAKTHNDRGVGEAQEGWSHLKNYLIHLPHFKN